MTEELTVTTERVDDIPLLLSQLGLMQIATLIDHHFPTHGNWKGLSLGKVVQGWLSFILSESNHRLNHVQPFVEERPRLFQSCLDSQVRALDFSDDRLASVLDYLSKDDSWEAFEADFAQNTLRVYDLECNRVRVDATTTKSYVGVTSDGLFQFGHSKDGRNDLAQVKINLSVLDPLGLPLTTTIVSGESADDPLYVPEISRVQQLLQGKKGVTYIGDCKMAALATRSYVAASGDYYLCPFAQAQIGAKRLAELLGAVFAGTEKLAEVFSEGVGFDKPQKIAEGYEYEVELAAESAGKKHVWRERRFVVCSLKYAEKQKESLLARIGEAQQEIESLNERKQGKRVLRTVEEFAEATHKVLQKKQVEGLLKLAYEEAGQRVEVRKYAGRAGGFREEKQVRVTARIEDEAVQKKIKSLGFRVYGTNHPTLTLTEVVKGYRGQYVIEQRIGRLKGKPLSLSPLYLSREARVKGLIRLLTIALRVLTLIEFQVRKKLQAEQSQLREIYAGNPKRATQRPTTEMMLKAFGRLTLTKIKVNGQILIHLTPLTKVQETILNLLGFTVDAYLRLIRHSSKPLFNLSEP